MFLLITLALSVLLAFTNDSELSGTSTITILETSYGKLLKTRDGTTCVTRCQMKDHPPGGRSVFLLLAESHLWETIRTRERPTHAIQLWNHCHF